MIYLFFIYHYYINIQLKSLELYHNPHADFQLEAMSRTDKKDQTDASQTLPSAEYEVIFEVINGMTTRQLAYRCWTLTPAIKAASTSQRCMCAQSWQDEKYKHGFFYQLVSIHLKTKPRFTRRSENINGRYLKK